MVPILMLNEKRATKNPPGTHSTCNHTLFSHPIQWTQVYALYTFLSLYVAVASTVYQAVDWRLLRLSVEAVD